MEDSSRLTCLCLYLVASSVVTFVDANDSVGKMTQRVQTVSALLQGPKGYILVVGDSERSREREKLFPYTS